MHLCVPSFDWLWLHLRKEARSGFWFVCDRNVLNSRQMKGTIAVTCLIDVFELSIPRHSSCGTVEILKNRFATGGKEKLSGFIFVTSDELMA